MKILIINSDAIYLKEGNNFIHKSTGGFLNNLKSIGLQPILFHFLLPLSSSSVTTFNLDENSIQIEGLHRKSSKISSYLKASYQLLKIFKKVDFVYCFYPNGFAYNLLLCKLLGKPYGLYIRGEHKIQSKLSKYLYKNAKFITTISPSFTEIVKNYNATSYTIAPMINYDLEDIIFQKPSKSIGGRKFLFIGRVERDKGVFELIEAIKDLKNSGTTDFVLKIIGQGKDFQHITELISAYQINDQVKLIGVVDDKLEIKKYYLEADLFILPTYHEGFPRVLYEAMIFKVPIVTTFVGSIPNLMKDRFNCFKIETMSSTSISNILQGILTDFNITKEIANNATITVQEYLTVNNRTHHEIINDNLRKYDK